MGAVIGCVGGNHLYIFRGRTDTAAGGGPKVAGTYEAYLRSETLRVVTPYLVLGTVIFFWALLILRTKFPKVAEEAERADGAIAR